MFLETKMMSTELFLKKDKKPPASLPKRGRGRAKKIENFNLLLE
jgi:hypothetical protein